LWIECLWLALSGWGGDWTSAIETFERRSICYCFPLARTYSGCFYCSRVWEFGMKIRVFSLGPRRIYIFHMS
jgi:hypothetical protein